MFTHFTCYSVCVAFLDEDPRCENALKHLRLTSVSLDYYMNSQPFSFSGLGTDGKRTGRQTGTSWSKSTGEDGFHWQSVDYRFTDSVLHGYKRKTQLLLVKEPFSNTISCSTRATPVTQMIFYHNRTAFHDSLLFLSVFTVIQKSHTKIPRHYIQWRKFVKFLKKSALA